MTYSGGEHFSVSGQPPHRARQYFTPASMKAVRASSSDPARNMTTLGAGESAMTALSSFPRLHFSQYGFGITRTSAPGVIRARKGCVRKRALVQLRDSFVIHHTKKAAPSDRPLRISPVAGGAPSQGVRNLSRLPVSFAFAARRPGQPFLPSDPHPPSKARVDHVRHVVVSKSTEARWPRLRSPQ